MKFAFDILFVMLVALDTALTAIILHRKIGVEVAGIAKYYIHNPILTIGITVLAVLFLISWLEFVK